MEGDATEATDDVPLVPPTWNTLSFFVVHPPVERAMDRKFADASQELTSIQVPRDKLLIAMDELGQAYLKATDARLAEGKPHFIAKFQSAERKIVVTAA